MEWMVVELSLEEQLAIETQSRLVLNCPDSKEVARLCSTLIKQNAHQSKLLLQSVQYIAALECGALAIPWWKRVFGHH